MDTNLIKEYCKISGDRPGHIKFHENSVLGQYVNFLENKIKNLGERSEPPHPMLDEVRLKRHEMNMIRQWYNAANDLNPKFMDDEDKKLYAKIMAHLA